MQGTEARRSCKDDEVEVLLHKLLVSVETRKLHILGDVHFLFVSSGDSFMGAVHLVDEGIGHGYELSIVLRV